MARAPENNPDPPGRKRSDGNRRRGRNSEEDKKNELIEKLQREYLAYFAAFFC